MVRSLALILACAAAAPSVASAQTSAGADLEEDARLHFELGERAYNRGAFAEAAGHFDEAYRLSHRAPLLYNAYLSYRDARDEPRAVDSLRRYLAEAGDLPNRARLEEVLRRLEAELTEGGTEGGATSSEAAVPVGPIVVLGAGAAIGIASIVTGALALARNDDLNAACPDNRCASEDARAIQADVDALSTTTDALWPIATLALAVGAVWVAIDLAVSPQASAQLACTGTGCTANFAGTFQ